MQCSSSPVQRSFTRKSWYMANRKYNTRSRVARTPPSAHIKSDMTSVTKQRLQKRSPAEGEPTSAKTTQMWGIGELLFAKSLSQQPWLAHAFSTRSFGTLGYRGEGGTDGEKNRARFLKVLAGGPAANFQLATLRQVHSDIIHRIESVSAERLIGDGLSSDVPGIVPAI